MRMGYAKKKSYVGDDRRLPDGTRALFPPFFLLFGSVECLDQCPVRATFSLWPVSLWPTSRLEQESAKHTHTHTHTYTQCPSHFLCQVTGALPLTYVWDTFLASTAIRAPRGFAFSYIFLIQTWHLLTRCLKLPALRVSLTGLSNCWFASTVVNQKLYLLAK